ncbi:HD domain-containing protein [Algoriphagus sp. NG3]|uniref:HD domain-containing protein n=1 Tax=Algoriphagus sp. NG3 TaxID=3097546 RepID=UPI002A832985|nr:HD domain-containing protein [Algoriphagus sp. NG3]WPR75979.1 HD domain-containing protein [Algoriphagus sp. NG3]
MQANTILEQVRRYADEAHGDQLRKYTKEPYIVHPERVMKICLEYTEQLPVAAAALLHDVLEDTEVGPQEMKGFLKTVMHAEEASYTVKLVIELTDVYTKEAYPQWNRDTRKQKELERIQKTSPNAQTIKYADILDNCKEIVAYDISFAPKYLQECGSILRTAMRGNKELRKFAMETLAQEKDNLQKRKSRKSNL